ncbi:hypothetical protein N2152v2_009891 [Parachlorella kessleri]
MGAPQIRQITLGLAAAQIALGVIIPAVTSTKLNPPGDCWLNLMPGSVCDFVYSTSGFSLLFSLLLAIPTLLFHLRATGKDASTPLIPAASHLALFGAFWWMVLAITITARGNQASDAGYPEESARGAVIAFSWIQMVLFLAVGVIVIFDRFQVWYARQKSKIPDDVSEESDEGYAYTRAHAHTPVS